MRKHLKGKNLLGVLVSVLVIAGAGAAVYFLGSTPQVSAQLPPPPSDEKLMEYYNRAVKFESDVVKDKNNINAYLDGGINWKTIGDFTKDNKYYDAAISLYERGIAVLEAGDDEAVFWLNIGNLQKLANRNDKAEAAYRKGIELFPGQAMNHLALIDFFQVLKKSPSEIKALYEKAIDDVRKKEEIIVYYAPYLRSIGEKQLALHYYEQIVKIYRDEPFFQKQVAELKAELASQ